MPQTVRQYWRGLQGRSRLTVDWDAISADSVVFVTASEYASHWEDPGPRFVGDATIVVDNISPYGGGGGVTFVVTVDWPSPLHVVTDITVLDDMPVDVRQEPPPWRRLAFDMQPQEEANWCWAAVATSVSHFYDAGSTWRQCDVANAQLGRNDCCAGAALAACDVYGFVDDALRRVGHFGRVTAAAADFAAGRKEVDAGRPLCLRVAWSGGGAHFLSLIGYLADDAGYVAVDDPIYGKSDLTYATLETAYQGSGAWTHSYYTLA